MDGLTGKVRSIFGSTMMVLTFSAVRVLIVDLDRPALTDRRLIKVDLQALEDLQRDMRK